ncbi:hypothetical protein [Thalassospira sp. CH_XMU1420-2]|uniref:hypothetical protein n=1 Tax=Thalassospira sp. CH_XMU1420-2 TaxID=3107769 RepID=UPI003007F41A
MASNIISPKPVDTRKDVRFKLDPDLAEALSSVQALMDRSGFVLHYDEEVEATVKRYLTKVAKAAPKQPGLPSNDLEELFSILEPVGIKRPA